ncbi:MAG: DUF1573 domain-containing protein [Candidatus Delongbacteria bacterium]|jgi:hypothetical protein|nr:DUF1573 domain-containing protein [Candidatus Delongbacteria bacterium]
MKKDCHIVAVLLIVMMISFPSCNSDNNDNETDNDGKITTSDVKNPISADGKSDMSSLPEFDFPVKEYNFGTVIQGEKVAYTFTFTNVGGSDLIINNVKASCGCTTPTWTKKPIAPGDKGEIEIVFNSQGRQGEQKKSVNVFANTQPNTTELRINCNIVTK